MPHTVGSMSKKRYALISSISAGECIDCPWDACVKGYIMHRVNVLTPQSPVNKSS